MLAKLLQQVLVVFIVIAYVSATTAQTVRSYVAKTDMNHAPLGGMTQDQDDPGDKTPCKGMLPGCVTDLGCIFLVSLPAPDLAFATVTAWSSVTYDHPSQGLRGRTIKPSLGPPIRTA